MLGGERVKKIMISITIIIVILLANSVVSAEPKCIRSPKNQKASLDEIFVESELKMIALIEVKALSYPEDVETTPSRQQYYSFELIKRIDEDEFEVDCNRCLVVDANKWAAIIPQTFKTQHVTPGFYLVKLQDSKRGSYQIIRNVFVDLKSYEDKKEYKEQRRNQKGTC